MTEPRNATSAKAARPSSGTNIFCQSISMAHSTATPEGRSSARPSRAASNGQPGWVETESAGWHQAPKRSHLGLARVMQRVGRVEDARMPRTHVDSLRPLQRRAFDRVGELLPRTQPEMLREIREDQPALAAGLEVRGQAAQEAAQHPALGIVDAVLQG